MTEPKKYEYAQKSSGWSWLRVYYYDICKDDLILDGVWPCLEAACPACFRGATYYQRDWVGGPSILVGIRRCRGINIPIVAAKIADYVARNPSTTVITATSHTRISESLSQLELSIIDDVSILHSNNSVVIQDKEPEALLLRQEAIKEATRDYLSESATFCIEWLRLVRAGSLARHRLALHLMVALIWLADPERLVPHWSLRSHVSGFLRGVDQDGHVARRFHNYYEQQAGAPTRALVTTTVEAMTRRHDVIPGITRFVDTLERTMADFYFGIKAGRYRPEPMTNPMADIPAWRSWQITISLLYRTLNQLGVTPLERFLACDLVSRACWDLYSFRSPELKSILDEPRLLAEQAFPFFTRIESSNRGSECQSKLQ